MEIDVRWLVTWDTYLKRRDALLQALSARKEPTEAEKLAVKDLTDSMPDPSVIVLKRTKKADHERHQRVTTKPAFGDFEDESI